MWCAVVHTGATVTTSLSPTMSERIRLTISVTPEVHAIFSRMADAAGISLGRCMGDWLADTAEGAQFVAAKMEAARSAPKTVLRELHAMSAGLHDLIGQSIGSLPASPGGRPPAGGARAGVKAISRLLQEGAPSSNTGLNPPPSKGRRQA